MKIISGKIHRPQKVVIYGTEGVGKTTLAAQFPKPLFIDVEGGTHQLDVDRTEAPGFYNHLLALLDDIPEGYQTLVIDTIDWTEKILIESICGKFKKSGLEEFGYGKGYTYLEEEFQKFLAKLDKLVTRMNVVLLAHAQIRKFELPDQAGAYDKYELKLTKKCSPLTKEWCDMMLFMNYYTLVDQDENKKARAVGGKERVLYTSHNAAWDAKNRHGFKDMLPAKWEAIAPAFTAEKQEVEVVNESDDPLERHEERVNAYLHQINWLEGEQTWRDLGVEYIDKIRNNMDRFLKSAGVAA